MYQSDVSNQVRYSDEARQYRSLTSAYRGIVRAFLYQCLSLGEALICYSDEVIGDYLKYASQRWAYILSLLRLTGPTTMGPRTRMLGINPRVVNRSNRWASLQLRLVNDLIEDLIYDARQALGLECQPYDFVEELGYMVMPIWSGHSRANKIKLGHIMSSLAYKWVREILDDRPVVIEDHLIKVRRNNRLWKQPVVGLCRPRPLAEFLRRKLRY